MSLSILPGLIRVIICRDALHPLRPADDLGSKPSISQALSPLESSFTGFLSLVTIYFLNPASNPRSYDAFKDPATTNVIQKLPAWARNPVIVGPHPWLNVLTTEIKPMTAVLSSGSTTIDRNAALGAISIDAKDDLTMRKAIEPDSEGGTGMSASAIADGKCVKTMVRTSPMRRERGTATRDDAAERRPVVKNRVPRVPSGRLNLTWKK
jgi:hypothetical protein